jgi:hypothetical protein
VIALAESGNNQALAAAIMEHASALVNLASALYCTHQYDEAEVAYLKALEVFELVQVRWRRGAGLAAGCRTPPVA